jgi:hypothetical protein
VLVKERNETGKKIPLRDYYFGWEPYVEAIAQPFQPWNGTQWFFDKSSTLRPIQPSGLMLTKIPKAASSTAAGVTCRMAHRIMAKTQRISKKKHAACWHYEDHQFSLDNHHSKRDPSKSFLWATVREPHTRALSSFFFFTRQGSEQKQLKILKKHVGIQLRQMRKREAVKANRLHISSAGVLLGGSAGLEDSIVLEDPKTLAFEHIQKRVLQWYDFIAVTERWEESMAVLKLLLDLEYVDLIILKSKESGGYHLEKGVCIYRPKATMPPAVEEYLETSFRQSNADYLLYAAVNRSLDLTIELLGRKRVEDGVRQFRHLQALAQERCLSQAVFPCTANGTFQDGWRENCYDRDWGCGYRCVDQVLDEYTSQKSKER